MQTMLYKMRKPAVLLTSEMKINYVNLWHTKMHWLDIAFYPIYINLIFTIYCVLTGTRKWCKWLVLIGDASTVYGWCSSINSKEKNIERKWKFIFWNLMNPHCMCLIKIKGIFKNIFLHIYCFLSVALNFH